MKPARTSDLRPVACKRRMQIGLGEGIRQRLFDHRLAARGRGRRRDPEGIAGGIEQAARAAALDNVDDGRAGRARGRQQACDIGERGLDAVERQLAGNIFVLRVDDDDRRLRKLRGRRA